MRQSSATSNTLWACVILFGQIAVQRYFVIVSTVGLLTLYIQQLPYMNTFYECIKKKSGRTHAHFQYNEILLKCQCSIPFNFQTSYRFILLLCTVYGKV